MIETGAPYTRDELATALRRVHGQSVAFLAALSDDAFITPQGPAWSPADHVRHLRRSVSPLVRAFSLPRLALLVRFGPALRRSRDFATMTAVYQKQLSQGATAGRFAPPPLELSEPVADFRRELMERWTQTVEELATRTGDWSEWGLDRLRLPHPLLGQLTIREMLEFTVYHNAHHVRRVAERAGVTA